MDPTKQTSNSEPQGVLGCLRNIREWHVWFYFPPKAPYERMSLLSGWGHYETIVPAAREAQVVCQIMKTPRFWVETQRNTEVLLKRYSDIPIPHPSRSPELFLGFSGIFCWYTLPETHSNRTWKWMAKEDACFLLGPGFLLQVLSFRECIPLPHHRKGKSSSKSSWNFWNKLSPGGFLQGILHRLCWGSEYLRRRYFGCLQLHL